MANIPYGESFEFNDWCHYYIDKNSTQYRYNTYSSIGVSITNESGFITPKAMKITGGCLTDTENRNTPNRFTSNSKNLKFTFTIWAKLASIYSANNYADTNILGLGCYANQRGATNIGFYNSWGPNVMVISYDDYSGYVKNSNIVAKITLPNNGTILNQWHHFAMCNDCTNYYYFVDGKLLYSEPTPTVTTFAMLGGSSASPMTFNDFYAMTNVCLWTEDFEVPDAPLYEKYTMKNIGGSGWVPPTPPSPIRNILKVY